MDRGELIEVAMQAMHDLYRQPGVAPNREYAAVVVDAIEPLIRADERANVPRVEIDAALGEPTTCKVWVGEHLVFDGIARGALFGGSSDE